MNGRLIADAFQTGGTVVDGSVVVVGLLAAAAACAVLALVCVLAQLVKRYRQADQHDTSSDPLRFLEELDAHLDDYVAADPQLAAGFARLRTAIRDEQQKKGD